MKKNSITFDPKSSYSITLKIADVEAPRQKDEAYTLTAGKAGINITANNVTGLYYGVQTLRQLIVKQDGKTTVAACDIHDFPAFKIRGLMHDVGRNFQTLEQLKMQIDVLAKYKMNIFHWHLTDHFGWRLESKKFPDLQKKEAFGRNVGKFYTQAEFKEMVEYCWARNIRIIPEFDSPGHSEAFRHGLGIKNMKEKRAKDSIVALINEVCTLADAEKMPYIHIGTDEVRHAEERVNGDYLPALHKAVQDNKREVIGWVKGMTLRGDTKQIQQTWAQVRPMKNLRHIDSRSNYINHMEALGFLPRMMFQQPCRVPHGDKLNLGGILAHWPDNRVADEKLTLTNNPVLPAAVAYSEAVWKGVEKDIYQYWATIPPHGTPERKRYNDMENRLAEHRDRFLTDVPFPFVKSQDIEWKLLDPVADKEVPDLENGILSDRYNHEGAIYNWTKNPVSGGAIHIKHFFGFPGHFKHFRKGKDIVWASTYIHSDKDQEIDAWINFNTTSTSDNRAGSPKHGFWSQNQACNIWINGKAVAPPKWANNGKKGKEVPFIDEVYSSRKPAKIKLKKGWNTVLVKTAPSWKWVFSFSPVSIENGVTREVEGLRFSAFKK